MLKTNPVDPNPNRIAVIYGEDPFEMMPSLLDALHLSHAIPIDGTIGIKPNLVVSKPSDSGATTDPRIVEALIVYLRNLGAKDIVILESAWIGDDTERAFDVCGYRELASRFEVPLLNVEASECVTRQSGDLSVRVCKAALGLDFLINVPVLKAHSQTRLTCALKNLKGLIPNAEKKRFHDLGLDHPIARLSTILRPHLSIVDGIIGDLSFEEGGNPVRMHRIFGGADPVLVDAYAARLLGYDTNEIAHVRLAAKFGVGSTDLERAEILTLNAPEPGTLDTLARRTADKYFEHIDQQRACSACLGSLLHGLLRADETRDLSRLIGKLCVGQGFSGMEAPGIGIGDCTRGLAKHLEGCPPSGREVRAFIEKLIPR